MLYYTKELSSNILLCHDFDFVILQLKNNLNRKRNIIQQQ